MLTLLLSLVEIQSHFHHRWNCVKKWLRPWVVQKGNWLNNFVKSLHFHSFTGWICTIKNLLLCFSQYYTRFKSYCCEAYNILRKSSSLILNLFKLMERSGIPDISADESGGLKVNWLFTSSEGCELYKEQSKTQNDMFLFVCVVHRGSAPGEIPVGFGRWGGYTFLPGSYQWKRQCSVPSNGWDHP